MTDYELLKWAAKAVGKWPALSHGAWLPLDDDGDALRLAVKLRISFWHEGEGPEGWTVAEVRGCGYNEHIEPHGDPCAATRRAIVRAAAEIGKAKHDR